MVSPDVKRTGDALLGIASKVHSQSDVMNALIEAYQLGSKEGADHVKAQLKTLVDDTQKKLGVVEEKYDRIVSEISPWGFISRKSPRS